MKESFRKQRKINQYKVLIRKLRLQKEGAQNEQVNSKKTNNN